MLSGTGRASAQIVTTQGEYDAIFEERADTLLARLAVEAQQKADQYRDRDDEPENPANVMTTKSDRVDLFEAALLIRTGIDAELGNRLIQEQAASPFRGGMFYIHDVMAAMLHAGEGITPETRAAVRRSLLEIPIYRGDTENHYVLYYTGLLLAAEQWPDEPGPDWFNGRSSAENLADARGFLNHWIELTTTIGQGEFDSPTYLTVYLAPLLTLRQFSQDPEMRDKAEAMLNWILADYAVEYLNGLYAGAHSRDYSYDAIKPEAAPSVGWGWTFFGSPIEVFRSDNVLAAWSDYRLPFVINNVANDRSEPYTQYERKRVRHIFRYGDEQNPPVYKTTYMTAEYALGSVQGGILQPIQQHTWDVTFGHEMENATLFTLHPYYSGIELAMFFPEEIEWLTDQVDRYHLVYTDPDKWNSSSPYERTFQHDRSLIVLYDIELSAEHGHVDGFFPKSLDTRAVDESGWIVVSAGNTYVGIYPLREYEWIEGEVNWRLRSSFRQNGFVVETGLKSDFGTIEDFKRALRAADLEYDVMAANGPISVRFETLSGDVMEFAYPGRRVLNGTTVDLDEIPLFRGPYLNGRDGRLTVRHGSHSLTIEPRKGKHE